MRQVRRKTADPAARPYLLKAKNEGIKLSWNRFENMLPQDGFARLGLTCTDCLQGPCRINPFSQTEERTICGFSRDELVYRSLHRFLGGRGENEGNGDLLNLAGRQADRLRIASKAQQLQQGQKAGSRQIGLGTLKEDYVNICLEELSPSVLGMVADLAGQLKGEAVSRGAKGFNIVLIGDLSPQYSFDTVTNQGGSELAILTGLVDLYVVGPGGLGLGRNVAPYYPTVFVQAGEEIRKEDLQEWFVQAAAAYTKRDSGRILPSEQLQVVQLDKPLQVPGLKASLDQGAYQGICILGGSSNVKMSQDELLMDAAVRLTDAGVFCLAYGNAAVTLGKYGLLEKVACLGSEVDAVKSLDLAAELGADKVVALFPELSSPRDLIIAFNLAALGVKVLTSVRLPVDGSKAAAEEIGRLIEYAEPKELISKALAKL